MSLLALIAAHGADGGTVDPPVEDTTPYAFPTAAPWNVPTPAITPTYEGSGEAIHPSVIDYLTMHGTPSWNGYRFWMGMTPYPSSNAAVENPSILASHDGYTWVVPPGLTNPIDPDPPGVAHNSDTELVHDPDTGRLWCYWREAASDVPENVLHASWSTNGTAWTKVGRVVVAPGSTAVDVTVSPSVIRLGSGAWRMFTTGRHPSDVNTLVMFRWSATSPVGPWTNEGMVSWSGPGTNKWHGGIRRIGGIYRGLMDADGGSGGQSVYAISSTDGQTWTTDMSPVVQDGSGGWDNRPYRAQLAPHEDGDRVHVWYSASGTSGWRTGYTQVPLSAWPDPPA